MGAAYAPGMATVILARHGRTAANTSGLLAGRSKGVHLDETGVAQAKAASGRLEGLQLAKVVSSPLERCRETARLMAPGLRAVADRRLLECDYGEWTGREIKQLAKEKLWRTVQVQPSGARFPGGESLQEMSARVVGAIRARDAEVEDESGEQAVWLAVSHGDPIKAILADALGMHLDAFQRIAVDPGSLSVVRYTPHRAFVLTMNSGAGSLGHLAAKPRKRRTRSSDAVVGGGAGPVAPKASATS
jgi:probable phosphomutase (TIGR03848 family)